MHYLRNEIPGIKTLQPEKLKKFYNRVAWFRTKKTFSHKGSTPDARKLELLLSATAILLTIGLRKYKYFRTVNKIIIYPTDYYSVLHKRQHLGEFNFGLKTLVFAADSVVEGFKDDTDNLNLAIHEFAHALYFETSGRSNWQALRFQWGFRKLERFFEVHKQSLANAEVGIRSYAFTNIFEFFAVLLEHFFESPEELAKEQPEMYSILRSMLNQ